MGQSHSAEMSCMSPQNHEGAKPQLPSTHKQGDGWDTFLMEEMSSYKSFSW